MWEYFFYSFTKYFLTIAHVDICFFIILIFLKKILFLFIINVGYIIGCTNIITINYDLMGDFNKFSGYKYNYYKK